MQDPLFTAPEPVPAPKRRARAAAVQPAAASPELWRLAAALPPALRVGTSSWNYPGWTGTVWAEDYAAAKLSKQGLTAYAQHPLMRALWPGPLVCRWNLNNCHGAYGYEDARQFYAPFDRIVDADLETRATLAKVIAGTVCGGQRACVTIGNKAEGSAPLSVVALAEALRKLLSATTRQAPTSRD